MEPASEYEYQVHFDKSKAVKLADKIMAGFRKAGIPNELWKIQPWMIAFHVEPQKPDLTEAIAGLYSLPEIMTVEQSIEPNTRVRIITVQLEPRWFVNEKSEGADADKKPARKRHPENDFQQEA